MDNDILTLDARNLRGTDSNSLLRLYDLAHERCRHSQSRQEKDRADRALQRIIQELRKRKVTF